MTRPCPITSLSPFTQLLFICIRNETADFDPYYAGRVMTQKVVDVNKSLASSSKSHFFLGVVLSRRNFFSCVCALIRVERYGGGQQQEPANHRNPRIVVQADLWNIGIIINLLENRRRSTR